MLVSLVLCISYSAKLVAWLTVSDAKLPFDTLEEMVASDYNYGTREGDIVQVLLQVK